VLLLASPGAHAELEAGWHQCCTHSYIRGGDMVHGAMNGGTSGTNAEQDSVKEMCQSTPNCSFVSFWGLNTTKYGNPIGNKMYSTRHASADAGVLRIASGTEQENALILSRCRPELQPMRVRRRAAH
jgi:hypothetical protein